MCAYDVHFAPLYHNAVRSRISEGEEEVARKPAGFAYGS